MIAWVTGKALPYLIAAAVALAAAALFTLGIAKLDGMIETAREEARTARDAFWQTKIAEANIKVATAAVNLARLSMQKDAELAEADRRFRDQQAEMEAKNAALPGADDCGLSRDRARLLNYPAASDGGGQSGRDGDRASAVTPGVRRPRHRARPGHHRGRDDDALGSRPWRAEDLRAAAAGGDRRHRRGRR